MDTEGSSPAVKRVAGALSSLFILI